MSWGPDRAKAHAAMRSIFQLLDTPSAIDAMAEEGAAAGQRAPARGALEFRNVHFACAFACGGGQPRVREHSTQPPPHTHPPPADPSRPDAPVLTDFSLSIAAGERVGVVGTSGCGKSTLVALCERWYDVSQGAVLLDGVDVRELPVGVVRQALGRECRRGAPLRAATIRA